MIQLEKYFRILFMDVAINRIVMNKFAEEHINRLSVNNPGGVFTPMLNDVSAAYTAYAGNLVNRFVLAAAQKGKTGGMNDSRLALLKLIAEDEALIKYTFREDKPTYLLFYPQGMEAFYRADLAELETMATAFKQTVADHSALFTAEFVSDIATRTATFVANRQAQLNVIGQVAGSRDSLLANRRALARQLTYNLLGIAQYHLGHPQRCDMYFDIHILNAAFRKSARQVSELVLPGQALLVYKALRKPDLKIWLKNTGQQPLRFGMVPKGAEVLVDDGLLLQPGQELHTTAAHLGFSSTHRHLMVQNNSPGEGYFEAVKGG